MFLLPKRVANSSFDSEMSTAMMREAFMIRAACTAFSPTPPTPSEAITKVLKELGAQGMDVKQFLAGAEPRYHLIDGSAAEEAPAEGDEEAKGEEKGLFAFGGSCVITLFRPGRIKFEADLLASSADHIETYARMGDKLGTLA